MPKHRVSQKGMPAQQKKFVMESEPALSRRDTHGPFAR